MLCYSEQVYICARLRSTVHVYHTRHCYIVVIIIDATFIIIVIQSAYHISTWFLLLFTSISIHTLILLYYLLGDLLPLDIAGDVILIPL